MQQEAPQKREIEEPASTFDDNLAELQAHMTQAVQDGDFMEAENTKNQMTELKINDYESRMQEMEFRHAQQKEEMEQAHQKQYAEFNQSWDEDLHNTQKEDAEVLTSFEMKQAEELQKHREEMDATLPTQYKASAKLLNLNKIKDTNAKMKKYADAHEVQQEAVVLEEEEIEKFAEERQKKLITAEATLIQKQQQEMNALKKKLESALNSKLKVREQEHNKLLQRYQNVRGEIEGQQKNELINFNKQYAPIAQLAKNYVAEQQQRSTMSPSKGGSRMGGSKISKGGSGNKKGGSSNRKNEAPASRPSNA